MKFLIVFAFIGLAAADVSHLVNTYLPPGQSSINYNQGSDALISTPVVTYERQQQIRPQITYSRQVQAPSVQIIDAGNNNGYDTGFIGGGISGNSLSVDSGSYGNSGLISAYDSGLSGSGQLIGGGGGFSGSGLGGGIVYQGGNSGSGYQSSGQLIGGGGLIGGSLLGGGNYGGDIVRTISAPVYSNAYESSVGTQYGSNGGYVYDKKH